MISNVEKDDLFVAKLKQDAIPLVYGKAPKALQLPEELMGVEPGIERIRAEHCLPLLRAPLHVPRKLLI